MTYDAGYSKRYAYDLLHGVEHSYVDAAPVRRHVEVLAAQGASLRAIAEVAGVSTTVVGNLMSGKQSRLQRRTAHRLAAVRLSDILGRPAAGGFIPIIGTRRRIQGLLALGWTHEHITAAMRQVRESVPVSHSLLSRRGEWITRATADVVADAYDVLSATPGPSLRTRQRAVKAGYAPPLAWDEGTIDDPDAVPSLGASPRGATAAERIDDWFDLVSAGEDPHRAALRCGWKSLASCERAAVRAGRSDFFTVTRRARGLAAA